MEEEFASPPVRIGILFARSFDKKVVVAQLWGKKCGTRSNAYLRLLLLESNSAHLSPVTLIVKQRSSPVRLFEKKYCGNYEDCKTHQH